MQSVTRTHDMDEAEAAYWDAVHYLQVAIADPHASIADKKECVDATAHALTAWAKAIQKAHAQQHAFKPSLTDVRRDLIEHIIDVQNGRYVRVNGIS